MAGRTVVRATAAGVAVGVAVAVAVVLTWPEDPDLLEGDEAAAAFIEAYERSQTVTVFVASEYRREAAWGEMAGTHELAQRPPDVLRRQDGSVDGRIGGRSVVCDTDPDDRVACISGDDELAAYDEHVAAGVARWENYFVGASPYYRVVGHPDGCFDLTMSQYLPASPFGSSTRFCFDSDTGALVYREMHHDEVVEVREATEVRPFVTDADFLLPR